MEKLAVEGKKTSLSLTTLEKQKKHNRMLGFQAEGVQLGWTQFFWAPQCLLNPKATS